MKNLSYKKIFIGLLLLVIPFSFIAISLYFAIKTFKKGELNETSKRQKHA